MVQVLGGPVMVECMLWWSVQVSSEAWFYLTLSVAVKMESRVSCDVGGVGDQLSVADAVHAFQQVSGVGAIEVEVKVS